MTGDHRRWRILDIIEEVEELEPYAGAFVVERALPPDRGTCSQPLVALVLLVVGSVGSVRRRTLRPRLAV
jgi:hypothetical protein